MAQSGVVMEQWRVMLGYCSVMMGQWCDNDKINYMMA